MEERWGLVLYSAINPLLCCHRNQNANTMTATKCRIFRREDLAAWDLLQRPIWVFDCRKNCMLWGNEASLALWNAKSLKEFLERDYDSDMSDSVKQRCRGVMSRVENGELFNEQVRVH